MSIQPFTTGPQAHIVVVDAYRPVRPLVTAFWEHGFSCVRVQSTPDTPPVYAGAASILDDFVGNVVHTGDFEATLAAVAAYNPVAVVAGGEVGVEFADRLSEALGLLTNGTAMSGARRDKYIMIEALRTAGLNAADQIRATDEDELYAWHAARGGRIVVKPLRSAGGDGVVFSNSPEESVAAFRRLVGKTDIFDSVNDGVVAQEYLSGPEYVVNTVSRDGQHYVTDVWSTGRVQANGMIDLCDALCLIDSAAPVVDELTKYAFQVLDAVGIQHGPGHLEIRVTPSGPCLVEVGARLPGGGIAAMAGRGTGESQMDLTVAAYTDPEKFLAKIGSTYRVQQFCAIVGMISPVDGVLKAYRGLDLIEQLEGFDSVQAVVPAGQRITRTVDDLSYPVVVTLVDENPEVVQTAVNSVRHIDGAGFYELAPD